MASTNQDAARIAIRGIHHDGIGVQGVWVHTTAIA